MGNKATISSLTQHRGLDEACIILNLDYSSNINYFTITLHIK